MLEEMSTAILERPQRIEEPAVEKEADKGVIETMHIKPLPPSILFTQRLKQGKLDKQFVKFLDVFKKLHINILFTEALENMPSYAKFLKDILSRKCKMEEFETMALIEECSAVI